MSHNLDELNRQKILDLMRAIWQNNHRFTDIHNELEWSKATLSKYLQALRDNQILEKGMTNSESIGYFFTDEGESLFKEQNLAESLQLDLDQEDIIESSKKKNELLEKLKEAGLFTTGMEMSDVKSILSEYPEEFSYDFSNGVTALQYRQFVLFLIRMFEPEIWDKEIEATIKINEENPDNLKKDIDDLKDSMEDIDWP
jgi:predicted transcriptional regulator